MKMNGKYSRISLSKNPEKQAILLKEFEKGTVWSNDKVKELAKILGI